MSQSTRRVSKIKVPMIKFNRGTWIVDETHKHPPTCIAGVLGELNGDATVANGFLSKSSQQLLQRVISTWDRLNCSIRGNSIVSNGFVAEYISHRRWTMWRSLQAETRGCFTGPLLQTFKYSLKYCQQVVNIQFTLLETWRKMIVGCIMKINHSNLCRFIYTRQSLVQLSYCFNKHLYSLTIFWWTKFLFFFVSSNNHFYYILIYSRALVL